jgi:signal transduction histidine kinase
VLPILQALPAEIGHAREAVSEGREAGLDRLVEETNRALESLRDLTRGVFPAQLARSGLELALRSLLTRAGTATVLTVDETGGRRYSPRVETAIYFCCAEALRTGAGPVSVDLSAVDGDLVLRIVGAHDRLDLQGVRDRVEAVGGALGTGAGLLVLTVPVAEDGAGPGRTRSVVPAGGPVGAAPGG